VPFETSIWASNKRQIRIKYIVFGFISPDRQIIFLLQTPIKVELSIVFDKNVVRIFGLFNQSIVEEGNKQVKQNTEDLPAKSVDL
jgi:hypothetical protein